MGITSCCPALSKLCGLCEGQVSVSLGRKHCATVTSNGCMGNEKQYEYRKHGETMHR